MTKETKNVVWTAAFFAVLALIMGWLVYSTSTESQLLTEEIAGLKSTISALKVKASDKVLEEKEKTKQELAAAVREYVKILPSEALVDQDSVRVLFSRYVQQANIQLIEVSKAAARRAPTRGRRRRGKPKKKDFEKLEFALKIRGDFENLVRFMNLIETDEKFFQIERFDLRPQEIDDKKGTLTSNLVVTTFQYKVK